MIADILSFFRRNEQMDSTALTLEECQFAEENHNLIYDFLHRRGKDIDTYYDVVVFGYLAAVKKYFQCPELAAKYKFSTLANSRMRTCLYNHFRAQRCKKRQGISISVNDLHQEPCPHDDIMDALNEELLLHQLALKFSPQQLAVAMLRSDGFSVREIAQKEKIPMVSIKQILTELRAAFREVLQEGV